VLVFPAERRVRVRGLHVHGAERQRVEAGERVAVNLAGVSKHELRRGDQLISQGPWTSTTLITVRLELLEASPHPLDEGDELEVHALACRTAAKVERLARRPLSPGAVTVAQIRLRDPVLLFPGDRLVLRRPAPVNTFAGGMVLDPRLGRCRRRDSSRLDELPAVHREAWPELLGRWISDAGLASISADDLAGRLGVLTEAVEAPLGRLLTNRGITCIGSRPARFVTASRLEKLAESARAELDRRLAGEEVSAGIPARDFAAALLPKRALQLSDAYLEELRCRGAIELSQGRVVPPGSEHHMTAAGEDLTRRVEALYRGAGVDSPSPQETADRLDARAATVEGICRFLVTRGRLVRLEGKLLVHRAVLDEVAREVRSWDADTFGVGEFKDRFGVSRKFAIPILEWLDSERVTVRQGNQRKIIRRGTE